MLGIETGNAEADREAEMWLMALIGVLVAAVPVALLSPSLGFRRKKRDARSSRVIEEILGTFLVALETADHV